MGINAHQIQAVDLFLSNLGISIQDYITAKQASSVPEVKEDTPITPFLSRQEVATLLRCSTDTVDNLIAAGKIKSAKLNSARCGRVLIDRKSVMTFVRNRITRSTERA